MEGSASRKLDDETRKRDTLQREVDETTRDLVDESSWESFPASDPPTFTPQTGIGGIHGKREPRIYNVSHFDPEHYDTSNFGGPKVGAQAPDFRLMTVDGEEVRLGALRGKKVVLETGCLSCPSFREHLPAMNQLAARHDDVVWLVLYTRELHPGRRLPAHATWTDKVQAAKALVSELGEKRTVLVDALDGRVHAAYGGLPNACFLIDEAGRVQRRWSWTIPEEVELALCGLEPPRGRRLEGGVAPPRPHAMPLIKTLWRSGPDAAWEYVRELPHLVSLRRRLSRRVGAKPERVQKCVSIQ